MNSRCYNVYTQVCMFWRFISFVHTKAKMDLSVNTSAWLFYCGPQKGNKTHTYDATQSHANIKSTCPVTNCEVVVVLQLRSCGLTCLVLFITFHEYFGQFRHFSRDIRRPQRPQEVNIGAVRFTTDWSSVSRCQIYLQK